MQDLAGIAVLTLLMAALGGYLVGSIPFGVLLTRAAGAGDVRNIGSGNIGATNVLRTGRKDLALATLLLDAGKGAAALLIARAVTDSDAVAAIAGGAAFLGHLYPVWLGFKGGKGVATFFGLMLAAAWPLGLVAAAVWLLTAAVFRVSSLSALIATLVTPVLALMPIAALNLPTSNSVFLLALAAMTLIWLRHFDNIIRLIKGKEPRIGAKSA
ncbi:glycerol-3-phosphate 1-O-acyltransferase PlsY [Brevundimonas halotolerans]|uniref:Glycerol-3-phosphate acyltransferase n=1 Tax=Brevundimonas halotolerans TaxID=69670 RepID=A0A7W9A1V3_9CAUL|nr:glycerol-3-phosphate 1-O-acyltransferase PlsY [Brevundimonas halotolerans]MBB5659615.1 glycerol-3-phosphate acyltransferase PlsY [Brevundimonas halotolerans]